MKKVHYTHFLLPMLLGIAIVLTVSSFVYGLYVHFYDETLPRVITYHIFPALIASVIGYFLVPKIRKYTVFKKIPSCTSTDLHSLVLYLLLIIPSTLLFSPLANSIRYNIGQVRYLNHIDEMLPYQQPTFLELGEWHTDRMRVMPIHTYERGKLWNRQQIHLKSMYLVPIFSQATAYRTTAKAWLTFKYEETIPYDEFVQNQGKPYFDQFLGHFKKINVTAFLYFEKYPQGKERQIFTNMARLHSYFQSGYANIYQGQTIDRDLISLRYFVYFLSAFFLFVLPIFWLIAKFLLQP